MMSSVMCDCEDFPCCDCGQEWLAEQRSYAAYGDGWDAPYDPDMFLNYEEFDDE